MYGGPHWHYWHHGWFAGMHIVWLVCWIVMAIMLVRLVTRSGVSSVGRPTESAIDVLKRRYAKGALSTAEYEERLAKLTGGAAQGPQ